MLSQMSGCRPLQSICPNLLDYEHSLLGVPSRDMRSDSSAVEGMRGTEAFARREDTFHMMAYML